MLVGGTDGVMGRIVLWMDGGLVRGSGLVVCVVASFYSVGGWFGFGFEVGDTLSVS